MHIDKVEIENFRLLGDVNLLLEEKSTVIVGRNNSGKTSLTELFRRLLGEGTAAFRLEDFSLSAHDQFWTAFKADRTDEQNVRGMLPSIKAKITIDYGRDASNVGALGEFIIDLDPASTKAVILIEYALKDGAISTFFKDIPQFDTLRSEAEQKREFCRAIRERIASNFTAAALAVDPSDQNNTKSIEWGTLRALISTGFINAQRGLDDVTHKERDVLGKVLEALLNNARSESATDADRGVATRLEDAVKNIQSSIDTGFNEQLQALLPAFSLFGYPGLANPGLRTETTLDVERLLTNHTKVHYTGVNGINLPEPYNGLGVRNLIFILLKLLEFFKSFASAAPSPAINLVFIEEPEVHLHPQMQEVFISKLTQISAIFVQQFTPGQNWPVQFVVTTHSSHIANKAPFDSMRYFMTRAAGNDTSVRTTVIKDLRAGLAGTSPPDREFLHKYMTLTRCDLLFADKAILIEGTSERLMLPEMVKKVEAVIGNPLLSTQYVSIVEVGGAYAHLFFPLLDFLELPTLIITDLDATRPNTNGYYMACKVSEGERTSNACIKSWFSSPDIGPRDLISKSDGDKTDGLCRIAYEVPETNGNPCGRSFEDAFILANPELFALTTTTEEAAWEKAQEQGKSDFALKYAIQDTTWVVPRYIAEGLVWLARFTPTTNNQALQTPAPQTPTTQTNQAANA
jgi:putative ATP-dependent endonuclease of the OLD family